MWGAGRPLFHVAVKLREVRQKTAAGWFTAARSSWLLPPQLLPLAHVPPPQICRSVDWSHSTFSDIFRALISLQVGCKKPTVTGESARRRCCIGCYGCLASPAS